MGFNSGLFGAIDKEKCSWEFCAAAVGLCCTTTNLIESCTKSPQQIQKKSTVYKKSWTSRYVGMLCKKSTSMYSLTFCDRVMSPERHHWKPAVQAAAVMLRTSPVDGQLPASQPRPLPIYGAQFWERLPSPASHRPVARADPAERLHYVVISRGGRKLVIRVRVSRYNRRLQGRDLHTGATVHLWRATVHP